MSPDLIGEDEHEHLQRIMRRAFENAFQAQIGKLYSVYIGNAPSVEQQQSYTKKGIENAIAAYRLAMAAVEAWDG